jgi:hypothetical protein
MISDNKSSSDVASLAIWALIRIGHRNPETLPTLKQLAQKKTLFWQTEIQEAIDYLERNK